MILRRKEAADGFRAVSTSRRAEAGTRPYAVILGHLAALLIGDEAEAAAFLRDSAARLDPSAWPYPAVRFLRGELDEAGLLALAVDDGKKTEGPLLPRPRPPGERPPRRGR